MNIFNLSRMRQLNKVILAFICLLTIALTGQAQVGKPRNRMAIGVNVGYTLNQIDFDPTVRQSKLGSPTFGVVFRYTTEKYFSTLCAFQAEFNYAKLGWKEDIVNSNGEPLSDTYQRDMHYIQLPLLTRLGWGREERGLQFYFVAGPQISYCFKEEAKQSATWTLNANGEPDRPNNMYQQYLLPVQHKFDYGLTAGIGLELNSKAGHFMLEGRYYYGLGDVFGNAKKDVFSRSAHGTIVVKATYLFDFLKD